MESAILSEAQRQIIPLLKQCSAEFYLAGGTAVALHLGHRKSIDFDLFTANTIRPSELQRQVTKTIGPIKRTLVSSADEYSILVAGVKLSFIAYPFEIAADTHWNDIITLPGLLPLAAMKAYALGRRAKWKDYVDLYFLIRDHASITLISAEAERTFGGNFNSRLFREQLIWFEGIDFSEQVEFMPGFAVTEAEMREFLLDAVKK